MKNILLTWQSVLDKTMNILNNENVNIRPDLGAILRFSVMETDGLSVEKLRLRLDREYKDYFQHWDMEKEAPENGRGINNPYKYLEGHPGFKTTKLKEDAKYHEILSREYSEIYDKIKRIKEK